MGGMVFVYVIISVLGTEVGRAYFGESLLQVSPSTFMWGLETIFEHQAYMAEPPPCVLRQGQ